MRVARALAVPNTRPGVTPGTATGAVTVVLVPNARFEGTEAVPIRNRGSRRGVGSDVSGMERRLESPPSCSRRAPSSVASRLGRQSLRQSRCQLDGDAWRSPGRALSVLSRHRRRRRRAGLAVRRHRVLLRVFERLLSVPGVARVDELALGLGSQALVECQDLSLAAGALLVSGDHVVEVRAPQ